MRMINYADKKGALNYNNTLRNVLRNSHAQTVIKRILHYDDDDDKPTRRYK